MEGNLDLAKLSRTVSYALRHEPWLYGRYGWGRGAYQKDREKKEIHELKEQVGEIRELYQDLIKTLNEAVDLREKVRANPQEFLEADPFKFAAMQKRRYNAEAHT